MIDPNCLICQTSKNYIINGNFSEPKFPSNLQSEQNIASLPGWTTSKLLERGLSSYYNNSCSLNPLVLEIENN